MFSNNVEVFNRYAQEYDMWFNKNRYVYESEIEALKHFIPKNGVGLEVGVGSGRFSVPLGIKIGVEPADAMADIARKRGITVYKARAEELPFEDESFDFVLFVVTICFVQQPIQALKEIKRVLKLNGSIIIGMIDKDSFLGTFYRKKARMSKFYNKAQFYSADQVIDWLKKMGFTKIQTRQTLFKMPKEVTTIEPVKEGYGEGGFVVISAKKSDKI